MIFACEYINVKRCLSKPQFCWWEYIVNSLTLISHEQSVTYLSVESLQMTLDPASAAILLVESESFSFLPLEQFWVSKTLICDIFTSDMNTGPKRKEKAIPECNAMSSFIYINI